MRLIKALGVAVALGTVGLTLVGSTPAAASKVKTVLCKTNQSLCLAANLWGEHVSIKAESQKTVLLGSLSVTCKSAVTVLAEKSDSDRVLGKITSLSWSNCSGCAAVETTTLPNISLFPVAGRNGKLETTSTATVLLLNCTIINFECTATVSKATLAFTGGTIGGTANASASKVPVALSGSPLCGASGEWDAGSLDSSPYVVTEVNGFKSGEIWVSPEAHA